MTKKENEKIKKLEQKYLTKVLKQLEGNFSDLNLINCEKEFTKFAKKLDYGEITLLRTGEELLNEFLHKVDYNNLNNVQDILIRLYDDNSLSISTLTIIVGTIIKYVVIKRKEVI